GFLLRHQRERLDEDYRPAGPLGRQSARFEQSTDAEGAAKRDERHAHRRVHEVSDEAAGQCDFSNRPAHSAPLKFPNWIDDKTGGPACPSVLPPLAPTT